MIWQCITLWRKNFLNWSLKSEKVAKGHHFGASEPNMSSFSVFCLSDYESYRSDDADSSDDDDGSA